MSRGNKVDTIWCAVCGVELTYDKFMKRWTNKNIDESQYPLHIMKSNRCWNNTMGSIYHEPLGNPSRLTRNLKQFHDMKLKIT